MSDQVAWYGSIEPAHEWKTIIVIGSLQSCFLQVKWPKKQCSHYEWNLDSVHRRGWKVGYWNRFGHFLCGILQELTDYCLYVRTQNYAALISYHLSVVAHGVAHQTEASHQHSCVAFERPLTSHKLERQKGGLLVREAQECGRYLRHQRKDCMMQYWRRAAGLASNVRVLGS